MTKITIYRAIVEQALEYMKSIGEMDMYPADWAIVGRLEAALAEPVQEPVQDDLIPPDLLFVCGQMGANVTRVRLAGPVQEQAEPVGKVTETSDSGFKVESTKLLDAGANLYAAPAKGESEGLVDAQVVYQISMKNGATSSAWIDVDEAAYNSAKVYGEYKCRCLYTAPPQLKPLTDEEIDCFAREANLIAESIWVDDSNDDITAFTTALTRLIERAHGIGDA
jgi:hypothetical protein